MAFLRITRDKRGYEYYSLVQPLPGPKGAVRERVIYWFRTPPNLKVGREPFDASAARALEERYPDVTFDWEAIRKAPLPPLPAEYWRERRRALKALRQSLREEEEGEAAAEEEGEPVGITGRGDATGEAARAAPSAQRPSQPSPEPPADGGGQVAPGAARRRRRRRRGRVRGARPEDGGTGGSSAASPTKGGEEQTPGNDPVDRG